jgi:putative SOS response-associated peptidase YedK
LILWRSGMDRLAVPVRARRRHGWDVFRERAAWHIAAGPVRCRPVCGRYRRTTRGEELAKLYGVAIPLARDVPISWNIAPGQDVLTLRFNAETGKRSLDALRWGLVPHWAKDPKVGHRLINARSETVDKTPSYRQAFTRRRCLIPADGFYEWRREAGRKVPFHVQMRNGLPFTLAGVWEGWQDRENAEWLRTCAILTCPANEIVQCAHNRMPVILDPEQHAAWVGEEESHFLKAFLVPYPAERMTMWETSPRVNSARQNDPSLIEQPLRD